MGMFKSREDIVDESEILLSKYGINDLIESNIKNKEADKLKRNGNKKKGE